MPCRTNTHGKSTAARILPTLPRTSAARAYLPPNQHIFLLCVCQPLRPFLLKKVRTGAILKKKKRHITLHYRKGSNTITFCTRVAGGHAVYSCHRSSQEPLERKCVTRNTGLRAAGSVRKIFALRGLPHLKPHALCFAGYYHAMSL